MKKFYVNYCQSNLWFHILLWFSIILIVASFLVPPLGILDSSVLAALGELCGFGAIGAVIKAIDSGRSAKLSKGDISVEINNDNNNNDNELE